MINLWRPAKMSPLWRNVLILLVKKLSQPSQTHTHLIEGILFSSRLCSSWISHSIKMCHPWQQIRKYFRSDTFIILIHALYNGVGGSSILEPYGKIKRLIFFFFFFIPTCINRQKISGELAWFACHGLEMTQKIQEEVRRCRADPRILSNMSLCLPSRRLGSALNWVL